MLKGRLLSMKKLLAVIIASALLLSIVSAMADPVTFTTKYFTMELPEGWEIDTESLKDESEENAEALGLFAAPDEIGLVAAAYLVYYENLKNLALWSSDADELQAYADAVMEDYADDNPVWLGTVSAGSIPFVLIKGTDEDGEYLYADTITNGYAIEFMAYVTDSEGEKYYPMTDEYIEQFKTILTSFKPVA